MAKEFYRNAKAYDLAFIDRDFDIECNFLEWCMKEHSLLLPVQLTDKKFLELAAGPSRHTLEMAKRNWKSYALDISEEMMNYANILAQKERLKIQTVVADMVNFDLPEKVDLAATLMESIAHLVTNEQMVEHLRSVARNMNSGGLYIIEATHPMFFFPDDEQNSWVSENGSMKVELTFGSPNDKYNSITQQWLVTTRMKIWENGNEFVTESLTPVRWWLAQEMKAMIELAGVFDAYWFYGSTYYLPPVPFDESEEAESMVIVLRVK